MALFQSGGATGRRTQGSHPSQAQSPHGPGLLPDAPHHSTCDTQGHIWWKTESHTTEAGTTVLSRAVPLTCVPSTHRARTGTGAFSVHLYCTFSFRVTTLGKSVLPKGRLPACTVSPQCLEGGYGGSLLTMDGGTHGCCSFGLEPHLWGQKFTRLPGSVACPSGPQAPGQATSRPGEADSGACRKHLCSELRSAASGGLIRSQDRSIEAVPTPSPWWGQEGSPDVSVWGTSASPPRRKLGFLMSSYSFLGYCLILQNLV